MSSSRLAGVLAIAASAASFGAMAIFARWAYGDGVSVVALLFLRFAIAGGLMGALMLFGRLRWPRGRNLLVLVLMGAAGYVGQSFAFFSALNYASAGMVALLLYLYPFLVTLLGAALHRQRLAAGRWLAVLAALGGTALTLGGDLSAQPLGIALGAGAALIYSFYILAGSRVMAEEQPLPAAAVVMLAAAAVFGLLCLTGEPRFPATMAGWGAVIAIAVVSTVIAMVGFFAGMKRLGAADAATLSTLEPVVTILLAALLLDEPLRAVQLVGGAVILGAVIYLARARTAAPA